MILSVLSNVSTELPDSDTTDFWKQIKTKHTHSSQTDTCILLSINSCLYDNYKRSGELKHYIFISSTGNGWCQSAYGQKPPKLALGHQNLDSRSLLKAFLKPPKLYELPHDKTNKMTVRPAKTQVSLGIRPIWSEPLLCAQWVAQGPSFFMRTAKTDQTGWMPRLIWVFAGRTCHFVGFVTRRSIYLWTEVLEIYYWGSFDQSNLLFCFCCFNCWEFREPKFIHLVTKF